MKLYLDDNIIEEIEANTFSALKSLEWLTLGSNKLKKFPLIELKTLKSLKLLNISHNCLTLTGEQFPYFENIYEM